MRSSTGSLKFEYAVKKGEVNILVLPVLPGRLARARSLRFWVKSDYPTALGVTLREKGGGSYTALFHTPPNQWQRVALDSSDFILNTGKDDPPDPDNRLDMDQVSSISLTDIHTLEVQGENIGVAKLLGLRVGSHTLYLSDFRFSDAPIPVVLHRMVDGAVPLDGANRPQIPWMGLGLVHLSRGAVDKNRERFLAADYHQTMGRIAGWVLPVRPGALAGAAGLAASLLTRKAAQLIVQLEETDGGRYNSRVKLEPGRVSEVHLPFLEFKPSMDSKDKNDKLDPELIKQVTFIDLSGVLGEVDQGNTVSVGKLRGYRAAPQRAIAAASPAGSAAAAVRHRPQ